MKSGNKLLIRLRVQKLRCIQLRAGTGPCVSREQIALVNIPPRRNKFLMLEELQKVCMATNSMITNIEPSFVTKIGVTKKFVDLPTEMNN